MRGTASMRPRGWERRPAGWTRLGSETLRFSSPMSVSRRLCRGFIALLITAKAASGTAARRCWKNQDETGFIYPNMQTVPINITTSKKTTTLKLVS